MNNLLSDYYNKYIKYKTKYIQLKKIQTGGDDGDIEKYVATYFNEKTLTVYGERHDYTDFLTKFVSELERTTEPPRNCC